MATVSKSAQLATSDISGAPNAGDWMPPKRPKWSYQPKFQRPVRSATNRTYNLRAFCYEGPAQQQRPGATEYFSRILESLQREPGTCGTTMSPSSTAMVGSAALVLPGALPLPLGVDGRMCGMRELLWTRRVLELVQSELSVVKVDHMFNNRTSITFRTTSSGKSKRCE